MFFRLNYYSGLATGTSAGPEKNLYSHQHISPVQPITGWKNNFGRWSCMNEYFKCRNRQQFLAQGAWVG